MTTGKHLAIIPRKPAFRTAAAPIVERELLREVFSGETEAYGTLFRRHQDGAYGLALHYTRNQEDAKDVVQDAFIKSFQNLHRFDTRRRFGPWLLSIVRNLSIDLLRQRKHRDHDLIPEVLEDRGARGSAERGLMRREVLATLSHLDSKHREIILLRDYWGYSYLEIADNLGIPLGTVMSRLHQSRKRFRKVLRRQKAA